VSAIEFSSDGYAFRNALRTVTSVSLSDDFDEVVVAGVYRPPTKAEQFISQLRTLFIAMLCGACGTLLLMQISLRIPTSPQHASDSTASTRTINLEKLMMLLDKPNQRMASLSLIEQCTETIKPGLLPPVKALPKVIRRASVPTYQILV
jgi:hypothetical protein